MTETTNLQLPDNWRDQLAGVIEPGDLYGVDDVVRLIESWCSSLPAGDDRIDITWTTCQACGTRWTPGDIQVCPECGGPALPATAPDPADQPSNITTDITPAGLGHCQIVEIPTADGPRAIRVHTGAPVSPQAAHALGALVEVAEAKLAAEHPHAGVIQELTLAWLHLRAAMPYRPDLQPAKDRMSAAIRAVRQAIDEADAMLTAPELHTNRQARALLARTLGMTFEATHGRSILDLCREVVGRLETSRANYQTADRRHQLVEESNRTAHAEIGRLNAELAELTRERDEWREHARRYGGDD